jgi:hypothetical protein
MPIPINLIEHIKIFIKKYNENSEFYFTMYSNEYSTIYSSYMELVIPKVVSNTSTETIDIDNDIDIEEHIINIFESKYKDLQMEITATNTYKF